VAPSGSLLSGALASSGSASAVGKPPLSRGRSAKPPSLLEGNGGAARPEEPSGPPRTSPNEAGRPAPRARPRHRTALRHLAQDMKTSDSLRLRSSAAAEGDPHDGLEPGLHRLVDH